jgi:hypothetical protein
MEIDIFTDLIEREEIPINQIGAIFQADWRTNRSTSRGFV